MYSFRMGNLTTLMNRNQTIGDLEDWVDNTFFNHNPSGIFQLLVKDGTQNIRTKWTNLPGLLSFAIAYLLENDPGVTRATTMEQLESWPPSRDTRIMAERSLILNNHHLVQLAEDDLHFIQKVRKLGNVIRDTPEWFAHTTTLPAQRPIAITFQNAVKYFYTLLDEGRMETASQDKFAIGLIGSLGRYNMMILDLSDVLRNLADKKQVFLQGDPNPAMMKRYTQYKTLALKMINILAGEIDLIVIGLYEAFYNHKFPVNLTLVTNGITIPLKYLTGDCDSWKTLVDIHIEDASGVFTGVYEGSLRSAGHAHAYPGRYYLLFQ